MVAVLYLTHWMGLLTPSWDREFDLQDYRKHDLLYWSGNANQRVQGNRAYRNARIASADRELARNQAERFIAPGYELVSHDTWLARFSASALPVGAHIWYKALDGLWWLGQ